MFEGAALDRKDQLKKISVSLAAVTDYPVPYRCAPLGDEPTLCWFFRADEGEYVNIRVSYTESQREQRGTIVELHVPLTSIGVHHRGETIPLSTESNDTFVLSFDTALAPTKLTEITGLKDALNAALKVPLRV